MAYAAKKIEEYRGIADLVIAELLTDDNEKGLTYGEVIELAGIAELSKETETSQETHYYDNKAAAVLSGEGADTYTLKVSALDLQRLALIAGRHYDEATGALLETVRKLKYFAVGYKTGLTGDAELGDYDRYCWKYKCQFDLPNEKAVTKDNNATAEGQELKLTSIMTNKKFPTAEGEEEAAKGLVVADVGKVDLKDFFSQVTFLADLQAKVAEAANAEPAGEEDPEA